MKSFDRFMRCGKVLGLSRLWETFDAGDDVPDNEILSDEGIPLYLHLSKGFEL